MRFRDPSMFGKMSFISSLACVVMIAGALYLAYKEKLKLEKITLSLTEMLKQQDEKLNKLLMVKEMDLRKCPFMSNQSAIGRLPTIFECREEDKEEEEKKKKKKEEEEKKKKEEEEKKKKEEEEEEDDEEEEEEKKKEEKPKKKGKRGRKAKE